MKRVDNVYPLKPLHDVRTTLELTSVAKSGTEDEAKKAVAALHWRGSRDVLEMALELSVSTSPKDRECAADILGQIGVPDRTYPKECFSALKGLLLDPDYEVVCAAIFGLQFIDQELAFPEVLPFCDHSEDAVRYAVASALGGLESDKAITALIKLMSDQDSDVRDWATFGIGTLCQVTTAEITKALAVRLHDIDPDVCREAVFGLAARKDTRAMPYLKEMLKADFEDLYAKEAAIALLGLPYGSDPGVEEILETLERLASFGISNNNDPLP